MWICTSAPSYAFMVLNMDWISYISVGVLYYVRVGKKKQVAVTLRICIVSILDEMKISKVVVIMMGWIELTTFAMAWSPSFLRLTLLLRLAEIVWYGKQRGLFMLYLLSQRSREGLQIWSGVPSYINYDGRPVVTGRSPVRHYLSHPPCHLVPDHRSKAGVNNCFH
jgi:hypothetical protein